MANKHMKICSISLVIREMQVKTTVRYYLTPTRMAIKTEQKTENTSWQVCRAIGTTLMHC